jgi:hypothetical protein
MSLTGHPIPEPKNNPVAHRVWETLDLIRQAYEGWDDLVWVSAKGYNEAWKQQVKVLTGRKSKLEQDRDRNMFILSIFCSGFGGGLLSGVLAGVFREGSEIVADVARAELSLAAQDASGRAMIAATTAFGESFLDNAGSQVGGGILPFLQNGLGGSTFESPGVDTVTFIADMKANLAMFFSGLRASAAYAYSAALAGKLKASQAETFYQAMAGLPFVETFPSHDDLKARNFQAEASLCLWIAWGARRDFRYWNQAWDAMSHPPAPEPAAAAAFGGADTSLGKYVYDMQFWELILDEIRTIDPHLVAHVLTRTVTPGGMHFDIRKLKNLGMYSSFESAQRLSGYFLAPNMPTDRTTAIKILRALGT